MSEFCRPCSRHMGFPSEDLEPGEICENCGAKGLPTGTGWVKVQITVLVLVLLALLSTAKAQSSLLVAHSLGEAKAIADTVAKGYRLPYKWYKTDSLRDSEIVMVCYKNQNNPDDKMQVVFSRFMEGANKELEIPGTPAYYLKFFNGKFLDLFPFYKRFVPAATAEQTSQQWNNKTLVDTEKGKREVRLHSEDDHWEIDIEKF